MSEKSELCELLEQYKLYVEMADRVSSRRIQTNRFYISLLSGLLALLYVFAGRDTSSLLPIVTLAIGIIGLVLCGLWVVNLRSYRQLNRGKFQIIHEMEEHLPFPCYKKEWDILSKTGYLQLTRVENGIPVVMALPYLLLFLYSIMSLLHLF